MKNNIIELKHVKKTFDGKNYVIKDFSLDIQEGEFVTFLGPSGCGKTTILRMIGGFDTPSSGEIFLDGQDISLLPPNKRPINTVFQKYALFPHLNVYDNITFGLKLKGMSKTDMDQKVKEALDIVDLEGFEKRNIATLSGGQQQRIAIARAIVNEPRVLLLDEPLSALDYKMRKEMQLELKNMHKQLGITFIFVTHDQEEALAMSDKVVVMAKGSIQQVGTPEEIYNEPANMFVADFIGESNIFKGVMEDDKKASFAGTIFQTVDDYTKGTKIDAIIRPEDVDIVKPQEGHLKGVVTSAEFIGTFYVTFVECGNYEMEIHTFEHYDEGTLVGLKIDPDMIHIIKQDDTLNRFEGEIVSYDDNGYTVRFADVQVCVSEGINAEDNAVGSALVGRKLWVRFDSEKAKLSDNIDDGIFSGRITAGFYIGDHYSYTIKSNTGAEYVADDEYLWNQGDMVSIAVDESAFRFSFQEGE